MTHQTHQFKFGDRVQDADGKQFIFLRGFLSSCTVAGEDGRTYDYLTNRLQPIPHPDTVRLDWIIKNGGEIQDSDGYVRFCIDPDVTPDLVENTRKCREAIDAVMQEQAAEAKE